MQNQSTLIRKFPRFLEVEFHNSVYYHKWIVVYPWLDDNSPLSAGGHIVKVRLVFEVVKLIA